VLLATPVETESPRPRLSSPDSEDAARGSWVSAILAVLVFAAGLVLAGWTLLRPFLPRG
jgi:hypothetical protein